MTRSMLFAYGTPFRVSLDVALRPDVRAVRATLFDAEEVVVLVELETDGVLVAARFDRGKALFLDDVHDVRLTGVHEVRLTGKREPALARAIRAAVQAP